MSFLKSPGNNDTKSDKNNLKKTFSLVLIMLLWLCMNYARVWAATFSTESGRNVKKPPYNQLFFLQLTTNTMTVTPDSNVTQTVEHTYTHTPDLTLSPSLTSITPSVTITITATLSSTLTPSATVTPSQTPFITSSLIPEDTETPTNTPSMVEEAVSPTPITATSTLKPFPSITFQIPTITKTPFLLYLRHEADSPRLSKENSSIFKPLSRFWALFLVFSFWALLLAWFVFIQLLDRRH